MTKFKKIVLTIVFIVLIPLASPLYFSHMTNFLEHLYNGEEIQANIVSKEYNRGSRSSSCSINYSYNIDGREYSGSDSISGACPNINTIKVSYLKNKPENSIIGFHANLLMIPLLILLIPFKVLIIKLRNRNNRVKFCVYNIIFLIFSLITVLSIVAFSLLVEISYKDFLTHLITLLYLAFAFLLLKGLYDNVIKYNLYKNGLVTNATVLSVIENKFNNDTLGYTLNYEYRINGKKYTRKEAFPANRKPVHKNNDIIPVLYNQSKPGVSFIDY